MDYITSRKKVYIPEYADLIKDTERLVYWKTQLKEGKNLIVYDFDGPRTNDVTVTCLEVTPELLIEKIKETKFPFGHGYVVAVSIAGIATNIYTRVSPIITRTL